MIYVLSLCGYEEYMPYWFECDCSKEDFDKTIKEAINSATDILISEPEHSDGFISGHELLPLVSKIFTEQYGYKLILPDYEVFMGGECLYSDHFEQPKTITDESWKKILEHNKKIHDGLFKDEGEDNE